MTYIGKNGTAYGTLDEKRNADAFFDFTHRAERRSVYLTPDIVFLIAVILVVLALGIFGNNPTTTAGSQSQPAQSSYATESLSLLHASEMPAPRTGRAVGA